MKKRTFATFCVLAYFGSVSFTENILISVTDAIKDPEMDVRWINNTDSPHYKEPVSIQIINNKSVPVSVSIEPGLVLEASVEAQQNLVITEKEIFTIAPGKKISKPLASMCIEQSDGAGAATTTYLLKGSGDDRLKKLATLISEKNYQTSEGQYAIWALIGNHPLYEIYGPDTVAALHLQQFVAAIRNETQPLTIATNSGYANNYYYRGPIEIELSGFFEYQLSSSKSIEIALFNERNVLERELLRKHVSKTGKHRFDYTFDAKAFDQDVYYIRLLVDDKIVLSRKIPLKEWKAEWEQDR